MSAATISEMFRALAGASLDDMVDAHEQLIVIAAQRDQLLVSLKRQALTIESQDRTIAEQLNAIDNAAARIRYLASELTRALEASKQTARRGPRPGDTWLVFPKRIRFCANNNEAAQVRRPGPIQLEF